MGITSLLIGGFIGCWIVASFWLVAAFVTDLTDRARETDQPPSTGASATGLERQASSAAPTIVV